MVKQYYYTLKKLVRIVQAEGLWGEFLERLLAKGLKFSGVGVILRPTAMSDDVVSTEYWRQFPPLTIWIGIHAQYTVRD